MDDVNPRPRPPEIPTTTQEVLLDPTWSKVGHETGFGVVLDSLHDVVLGRRLPVLRVGWVRDKCDLRLNNPEHRYSVHGMWIIEGLRSDIRVTLA